MLPQNQRKRFSLLNLFISKFTQTVAVSQIYLWRVRRHTVPLAAEAASLQNTGGLPMEQ